MLESLTKKQKIIFFIILSIMISVIIYFIYSTIYLNDFLYFNTETDFNTNELIDNSSKDISSNNLNLDKSETNLIIVYVCGAVKENKVVTLEENSRICDAIDAVGGLQDNADLTNINLAYILEDGEKIYIPKKGEVVDAESSASSSSQNSSFINYSSSSLKNNKININKASQTELETIPGVGPSTALKIINYREKNGKFNSIEDIKNVAGIGDAKYNKMKDYISVK